MRVTGKNRSSRRAARLRRQLAERTVQKQVRAYNQLVEAGIGLVKCWSLAAVILPDHINVLSALLAFVDASFTSEKPRKAKTDAIGLALRAAYLYGKFNGALPEPEAVATPEDNMKESRPDEQGE